MASQLTCIAPTIGLELRDFDLTCPLGDDALAYVRSCIAEHLVTRPPAGFPWHTDLTWLRDGPVLGFLNAIVIPPSGGDTLWANTAAIYDRLSDAERRYCEARSAIHRADPSLLASIQRDHGSSVVSRLVAAHPPLERPLVRVHPVTQRRSLFLAPLSTTQIGGAPDDTSLASLNRHLDDPDVQMRWRWRAGDLVIWDETSTCHRALTDHHPQRRVMRRCVTSGR